MTPVPAGGDSPEATDAAAPIGRGRRERKYATVLFADIVGSTSMTEREDPEVVQSLVGSTFDRLSEIVGRFGGITEKFIGDAVLAVFGVPAVHEDDPERAVRAALAMQELLAGRGGHGAPGSPPIAMRMGIEAGELLVDQERVTGSRDRMLTGDVVNTAARLQQVAEPGDVVVGPEAYAATRWCVDYHDLGGLELKGKSDAVHAWRAVRAKPRPGGRAPLGLEAALTGRDDEMALLMQTARRVRSEGRPGLITILGAAGVGKSRLALELQRRLEHGDDAVWSLTGRCLPYAAVSYSALVEAVKQGCGILDDDPTDVVAEKTARTVEGLFGGSEMVPHLEALVGSPLEQRFTREQLFDAWRRFLERLAVRRPLLLVLEDIHWADEGLLDFVDHLAGWAQGPILIVTMARPELLERRPGWGGGKGNHTAIDLDPLPRADMRELLEALLGTRMPDELAETITTRCEGNPLFGEEIVRMLIDRGAIRRGDGDAWEVVRAVEDVEVPRSVQTLIAARLDSLPDAEKAVLQDAAVIGRTFWVGAVERLSERDPRVVSEALGHARGKEILVTHEPSAFSGEAELSFRHTLIRDAAYGSLPKAMRADKHVAVAAWAEERAGDRGEQIAELLATHHTAALAYRDELGQDAGELVAVAARWTRAAGARASRLWQQREAARWLRAAVDLLERMGTRSGERAEAWESYARAAEAVEPYATVAEASERALALYEESGRQADAGRMEAWLAHVAFQSGDDLGVEMWAQRALDRLEPLGESRDLALALVHLGWYQHRQGRDVEAAPHLERAVAMAGEAGDPVVEGRAMLSLGMVQLKSGSGRDGLALLDAGLDIARAAGDLSFLLWSLLVVSEGIELTTCDYRRAESLVREGLELASRAGHVEQSAWMLGNLADYLVDMGRLDEATEPMVEGLRAARAAGETPRIAYSLVMNAYVHALREELDEADRLLDELRAIVEQSAETYHEGWAEIIQLLVARARGRDAGATEALFERAKRSRDRLEPWAGNLLLLECVRSLVHRGRRDEAGEYRERLVELARISASSRTFLAWVDGLLASRPADARHALEAAVRGFASLERRVEQGRCLIDLAGVERSMGDDPGPSLAHARTILRTCGATLFLREVDAAGPATGRPGGGGPA